MPNLTQATTGGAQPIVPISTPDVPAKQDVFPPLVTVPPDALLAGLANKNIMDLAQTYFRADSLIKLPLNATSGTVILNVSIFNDYTNPLIKLIWYLHHRFNGVITYRVTVFGNQNLYGALEMGVTAEHFEVPTINDLRVLQAKTAPANGTIMYTFSLGTIVGASGIMHCFYATGTTLSGDVTAMKLVDSARLVVLANVPLQAALGADTTEIYMQIESRIEPNSAFAAISFDRILAALTALTPTVENLVKNKLTVTGSSLVSDINGRTVKSIFGNDPVYLSLDGLYQFQTTDSDEDLSFIKSDDSWPDDEYLQLSITYKDNTLYFTNSGDTQVSGVRHQGQKYLGAHPTAAKTDMYRLRYYVDTKAYLIEQTIYAKSELELTVQDLSAIYPGPMVKKHREVKFLFVIDSSLDVSIPIYDGDQVDNFFDLLAEGNHDGMTTLYTQASDKRILTCQSLTGVSLLNGELIMRIYNYAKDTVHAGADVTFGSTGVRLLMKDTSGVTGYVYGFFCYSDYEMVYEYCLPPTINGTPIRSLNFVMEMREYGVAGYMPKDYPLGITTSDTNPLHFYFRNKCPLSNPKIELTDIQYTYGEFTIAPEYTLYSKVPELTRRVVFTKEIPGTVSSALVDDGIPTVATLSPDFPELDETGIISFNLVTPNNNQTIMTVMWDPRYKAFYSRYSVELPKYATYNSHGTADLILRNAYQTSIGNLPSISLARDFITREVTLGDADTLMLSMVNGPTISTISRRMLRKVAK